MVYSPGGYSFAILWNLEEPRCAHRFPIKMAMVFWGSPPCLGKARSYFGEVQDHHFDDAPHVGQTPRVIQWVVYFPIDSRFVHLSYRLLVYNPQSHLSSYHLACPRLDILCIFYLFTSTLTVPLSWQIPPIHLSLLVPSGKLT